MSKQPKKKQKVEEVKPVEVTTTTAAADDYRFQITKQQKNVPKVVDLSPVLADMRTSINTMTENFQNLDFLKDEFRTKLSPKTDQNQLAGLFVSIGEFNTMLDKMQELVKQAQDMIAPVLAASIPKDGSATFDNVSLSIDTIPNKTNVTETMLKTILPPDKAKTLVQAFAIQFGQVKKPLSRVFLEKIIRPQDAAKVLNLAQGSTLFLVARKVDPSTDDTKEEDAEAPPMDDDDDAADNNDKPDEKEEGETVENNDDPVTDDATSAEQEE